MDSEIILKQFFKKLENDNELKSLINDYDKFIGDLSVLIEDEKFSEYKIKKLIEEQSNDD
jgi:hypothetical protein